MFTAWMVLGIFIQKMALWLSKYIRVGADCGNPNLDNSCYNQITSTVALAKVIYLGFVEDNAINYCFLMPQINNITKKNTFNKKKTITQCGTTSIFITSPIHIKITM